MKIGQIDTDSIFEGNWNWVSKSLDGIEKRFPTSDIAGRDAWSTSYAKPAKPAAAPKQPEIDLDAVWRKVEDVVSNIFPDGDPIDYLAPWLQKQGITDFKIGDTLDAAAKKNGYDDIYAYYDSMKDLYSKDMTAEQEIMELSNDLLAKYKTAAGQAASAADKRGDYATGNKRFSGIVKATKKQFNNDAKKTTETANIYNDHRMWANRVLDQHADADMGYDEIVELLTANEIPDHIAHEIAIDMGRIQEGTMGGINRSAPAQDVSYEKVLDPNPQSAHMRVVGEEQVNELNVDTLRSYAKKTAEPRSTDRLGKVLKHKRGHEQAIQKIAVKTGDKTPKQAASRTYEERLAEFIDMDEDKRDDIAKQFGDILGKQHKEVQATKKGDIQKLPSKNENFMIWFRSQIDKLKPVEWQVRDKTGDKIIHSGKSSNEKDAFNDAENMIAKSQETSAASKTLTLNFNAAFARALGGEGSAIWVDFDSGPTMNYSLQPQQGYKKTVIRTPEHSRTAGAALLPVTTMSPSEANKIGLRANSRYTLGPRLELDADNGIYGFELQWHSRVEKGIPVPLKEPSITVSESEKSVEEDITPWGGYTPDDKKANALAKAPKSTMQGKGDVRFSDMVKDTIETHGLPWAFDYYVKKHGLPPKQFQIFAGLTTKAKAAEPKKPDWTDPSKSNRPKPQSWWQKLRGKLPFEE